MSKVLGCSLCAAALPSCSFIDGELSFCCVGCHAVFQILSTQNAIHQFENHPLFQQAVRSGLISNPLLLEQQKKKQLMLNNPLNRLHIEIQGMWCPSCAKVIKWVLLQEKGIKNCIVDYTTDLASIEYSPHYLGKEKISQLIRKMGYEVVLLEAQEKKSISFSFYLRFIVAAFCALNLMMFAYPIYASYFNSVDGGYASLFAWLSLFISLPVLGYSAYPIYRRFMLSLRTGFFGMETLVVIGVSAAFILSFYEVIVGTNKIYFDSMAVVIAFVLLGKMIETKAKFSSKETLIRLNRSLPRRGRKKYIDGSQKFIPLKEVGKNELLVAYVGEKIVLDGVVVEGEGSCDESLMTGEAIPVQKKIGDKVLAGTFLQSGSIVYSVTGSLDQTALHLIIDTISQEIENKVYCMPLVERISRWFVPLVIVIAASTAVFSFFLGIQVEGSVVQTALLRAIAVLLIACPCAIGIAAPLAESYLIQAMASLGVLIRNRGCLHFLGKETTYLFDKTGTITEGRFSVLQGLENLTSSHLQILKSLSTHSTHPISSAIAWAIDGEPRSFSSIEEIAGNGLKGKLGDKIYLLGSASFLKGSCGIVCPVVKDSSEIISYVYFSENDSLLATIALGDRIRPGISEMISSLGSVEKMIISGDAENAVKAVAQNLRTDYRFGMSPLHKRDLIEEFRKKGKTICFIGDGINDAPALAGAHVGISVMNAADSTIQVSDILLTTDQLAILPAMRILASKGRKILRQNLFWAFVYNIIGIFLAVFGLLTPIFAAFAMVTSSLIVLFNSHRLKFE